MHADELTQIPEVQDETEQPKKNLNYATLLVQEVLLLKVPREQKWQDDSDEENTLFELAQVKQEPEFKQVEH